MRPLRWPQLNRSGVLTSRDQDASTQVDTGRGQLATSRRQRPREEPACLHLELGRPDARTQEETSGWCFVTQLELTGARGRPWQQHGGRGGRTQGEQALVAASAGHLHGRGSDTHVPGEPGRGPLRVHPAGLQDDEMKSQTSPAQKCREHMDLANVTYSVFPGTNPTAGAGYRAPFPVELMALWGGRS